MNLGAYLPLVLPLTIAAVLLPGNLAQWAVNGGLWVATAPSLPRLDATEDVFTFRETRSDRVFSPWDAEEISTSTTFSIADAVADLEAFHLGDNEDLAELDSGPTHIPLPTGSDTLTGILLAECPRHPRHLRTAGPSIKAQFDLRKVRIAATGWIGLRDNRVSPEEAEAGVKQDGYMPIHLLPNFFGVKAIFHTFHLAKYLGPEAVPLLTNVARSAPFLGGALPRMTSWRQCTTQPWKQWKRRAQWSLADERLLHRRGNWAPLTKGASFCGGQTEPGELLNTAVLCCLVSNLAFIRFAGFATGVFAAWAPDLFDFYGTTILIPSAAIFHSNIPLTKGEHRYSFTQYTAGRLFRWVEHGFKTEEEYLEGLSKRERREERELRKERASEGAGLFSTIAELKVMA
ncbi:hypothetical protein DFH09DRAFT_1336011 [Mycena vulgaris]|nr:hypothetical protein DFH09DRAFT_1336011 [Mycena vulgaris]